MSGFLYFVPGKSRINVPGDLPALGLDHVFRDTAPIERGVNRGPTDGTGGGVIIAAKGSVAPERLMLQPNGGAQRWRPIPNNPAKAWCGMYVEDPPTPDELIRSRVIDGHLMTLGDGRQWLCPIARAVGQTAAGPRDYCALPRTTDIGDDGNWSVGEIDMLFVDLWSIACNYFDALSDAIDAAAGDDESQGDEARKLAVEFDFAGVRENAMRCLQAHYKVNRIEVVMLDLFRAEDHAHNVLQALIDWPGRLALYNAIADEMSKKKDGAPAHGSSSIAAG
jgi:hypothetical protein